MLLATAKSLTKHKAWIYVLACEGDRFYVGFSRYLHHRLRQHFTGFGAFYTRQHRPLHVVETREADSENDEFELWKIYAAEYGWSNVGGYSPRICKILGFKWPNLPRTRNDVSFWNRVRQTHRRLDVSILFGSELALSSSGIIASRRIEN